MLTVLTTYTSQQTGNQSSYSPTTKTIYDYEGYERQKQYMKQYR